MTLTPLLMLLALTANAADLPSLYNEPGINPYGDYNSNANGEVIDTQSGALKFMHTDLFVPTNGIDISIVRSYSSGQGQLPHDQTLGVGWSLHFGRIKTQYGCGNGGPKVVKSHPVAILQDGGYMSLIPNDAEPLKTASGNAHYITPQRWKADCQPFTIGNNTVTGFVLTAPNGMVYKFGVYGVIGTGTIFNEKYYLMHEMVDTFGNKLLVNYFDNAAGRTLINSVVSQSKDGEQVTANFTYFDVDEIKARIKSIASEGKLWQYDYETVSTGSVFSPNIYFLNKVTRPDGLFWEYKRQ